MSENDAPYREVNFILSPDAILNSRTLGAEELNEARAAVNEAIRKADNVRYVAVNLAEFSVWTRRVIELQAKNTGWYASVSPEGILNLADTR
jgi:hypothetical protein